MSLSLWKRFRYRVEWLFLVLLARAIPLLPRAGCVALARGLGWLAYYLDFKGRKVALANLELAFRDCYTAAERQGIARRSYQNFARTFLDVFWSQRLTPENWQEHIEVHGAEEFVRTRQREKPPGGIMMCIHWGNFEWASLAVGFLGAPTMIVTENFKNPLLTAFFSQGRQVSGHTTISQENSMIRMLKVVKRRGLTGMLIDLTVRPEQAAVIIDAFGRKMSVTFLHAVLAQRGGADLLPVDGEPLPDGRVRVTIHPPLPISPEATHQQIAQACWDLFEPRIRERPDLWMWTYKHWRYRPRGADPADYPFYANDTSYFFDKLLKEQSGETR